MAKSGRDTGGTLGIRLVNDAIESQVLPNAVLASSILPTNKM